MIIVQDNAQNLTDKTLILNLYFDIFIMDNNTAPKEMFVSHAVVVSLPHRFKYFSDFSFA